MEYINYHKHTHESNLRTIDVLVKPIDYINRIKELNHTVYSTCEHGSAGLYRDAWDLCNQHNIKTIFTMECYYCDDIYDEDNKKTHHIILIAKNQKSVEKLNYINSLANLEGFYGKPRVDLNMLLSLSKEDIFITTACIASRLFHSDYENQFVNPLFNHFGDSFFLEIQCHTNKKQVEFNQKIKELIQRRPELKQQLIHANDSHYIYPEQDKDRTTFIQTKGMFYPEEEGFILDYPTYEEIINRYKKQGVFDEDEINISLNNTLRFKNETEELYFDKEIKMPKIATDKQAEIETTQIINETFKDLVNRGLIDKSLIDTYRKEIKNECKIIKETNTIHYFHINALITKLAKEKYGGVLSRTGRGSAVSFFVNRLLGFTEVNRIESKVTMYPTRFMSTARILQSKSMPDIDFNWVSDEAPYKASQDILGEHNVYRMVALKKIQAKSAFSLHCKSLGLEEGHYRPISKNIEDYETHEYWGKLIDESKKYIGVIDAISPHPCAFLLANEDLRKDIGVIKIKSENCILMDGDEASRFGYLKNDYLTVTVWGIINETFKAIGQDIICVEELLKKCLDNPKVWDIYGKVITTTLNQVDTDNSKTHMKIYKAKSIEELTAFVAGIRPNFKSLLNNFLNREKYTSGETKIDELLSDTKGYLLYQESIMSFLIFCGMEESETYDIIKKISKKKFTPQEKIDLKNKVYEGYVKKIGNDINFDAIYQAIQDSADYSFNASHAYCVALDSLYGAYLKAYYPLEYLTSAINVLSAKESKNDLEKIALLKEEGEEFFNINFKSIKFYQSKINATFDKQTNTIYNGISGIKGITSNVANEIISIYDNKHKHKYFTDVLIDIRFNTKLTTKSVKALIILNYFAQFGKVGELLYIYELFYKFVNQKKYPSIIKKNKICEYPTNVQQIIKAKGKETDSQYNIKDIVFDIIKSFNINNNNPMDTGQLLKLELDLFGKLHNRHEDIPNKFWIVEEIIMKPNYNRASICNINNNKRISFYPKKENYLLQKIQKGSIITYDDKTKTYNLIK